MIEETRCPFCKLKVFMDEEALSIAHESPVCKEFNALASRGDPEKREVQPEAMEAHMAALRTRARARRKDGGS